MDRHILLVEDNRDDIELVRIAFERAGVANRLEVARDGEEALQRLLGGTLPLPVLLLLDLRLPKVGGLEVLRRLREDPRTRLLPVVVLTTSQTDGDMVESYRLGANSYIRKPVDMDQFIAAMQRLGMYWMVLNVPPEPAR
ncbi:response regulator [Vulcaniibacterium thermophilum]|jgi:two-component system response regulator|uniref:Response regulator n=1 Tax=Vulcaniibacterium thermophilum TaxID=1169913 RepID=A0A919DAL1_9GAMM|nr:response regulator [Vulcaniibacterium thermophilum]GHE28008.1 response regulator [Vulcaniibacterium thermophilum]